MNIDNVMLINGGTMLLAIGGLALAMGQKSVRGTELTNRNNSRAVGQF